MYNASAQFHNAVFENSPVERVLFRFADGTIFTNEDIHIGNGLKVIEAVNLEEELTIGGCPASSLEATIMNYHGLLSGFAFGEAEVSLGVRTGINDITPIEANAMVILRYEMDHPLVVTGHDTAPYLRVNGDGPTVQPPFPVKAIMSMDNTIFCINDEGEVWQAAWIDGQTWNRMSEQTWNDVSGDTWDSWQGILVPSGDSTLWQDLDGLTWDDLQNSQWNSFLALVEFNAFMKNKFKKWAEMHTGTSYNGNVSYEFYVNGTVEKYEYMKLGTFLLNTPTKRKVNLISVSALDRMARFDVAADAFWNGLTYPVTIGQIFTQLCTFVGVPKATTSFINSTRSFSEAPMVAEGITAREILSWIAEAACSFARMTRDGEVELAWFGTRPVTIPMTQYFGMSPAEYEVAPIDKLQISGSATDIGVIIGEGENGYQILDNPLLYGETDAEIRTLGVPIYNRLVAYAAFSPINATAVCDWSIQAGDIIEIVLNGVTYALPVYSQTITWKGNARVSYESSGAEKRPVMAASNRRVYAQKRAIHEVNETVDGLTRRIEDTEDNVTNLELFADSLTLSVANGSTSSTLKLMAGSTELSSANITLTGMVTFANLTDGVTQISGGNIKTGTIAAARLDLSGVLTATDVGAGGSTIIDGGRITTGTVAAARIDVDNLSVKHLDGADGTFSGSLDAATGSFKGSLSAATGTFSGKMEVGSSKIEMANNEDVEISGDGITLEANNIALSVSGSDMVQVADGFYLSPYWIPQSGGGNKYLAWDQSSGQVMYSNPSTIRVKENIREIGSVEFDRLRPVRFNYVFDSTKRENLSFIAEEIEGIIPEAVTYEECNGKRFPDGIDFNQIIPVLVAEIQNLRRRMGVLENGVA